MRYVAARHKHITLHPIQMIFTVLYSMLLKTFPNNMQLSYPMKPKEFCRNEKPYFQV